MIKHDIGTKIVNGDIVPFKCVELEPGEVVLSGPEAQAIYHSLLRQWIRGDNFQLIRAAMGKIAEQYGKELEL